MEDGSAGPSGRGAHAARRERRIIALRINRRVGLARIGYLLDIHSP
jgi:hypothetical protein